MRFPGVFGLVTAWSLVAMGQENQAAEALFNKGVDALEAGRYADACPALAESQRLDPRPGTLFTLADCEGRWGKALQAYLHYRDYLRQVEKLPAAQKTKHSERQAKANETLAKLQKQIARLNFPGAKAETEVTIDGQRLPADQVLEGTAVEPGERRLVIRNDGVDTPSSVALKAGEAYEFPVLAGATVKTEATASAPAPVASSAPSPSPTAFYAAAGVGVVGLSVGLLGGLLAISKKSEVSDECKGLACSSAGLAAVDRGRSYATVSSTGFVLGALGAGVAAGLWLSGVSSPKKSVAWVAPSVGAGQAGLALGGAW